MPVVSFTATAGLRPMISFCKTVVATIFAAIIGTSGYAASASGAASVRILPAVTVAKVADLNFGKIVAGSSASTVAITETGARTCGTGLSCSGTVTAGAFELTGATGETVSITVDSAAAVLTSGSNAISASLATSTRSVSLAGGTNMFRIGGTLSIAANQAPGSYTGSFTVTVDYQ